MEIWRKYTSGRVGTKIIIMRMDLLLSQVFAIKIPMIIKNINEIRSNGDHYGEKFYSGPNGSDNTEWSFGMDSTEDGGFIIIGSAYTQQILVAMMYMLSKLIVKVIIFGAILMELKWMIVVIQSSKHKMEDIFLLVQKTVMMEW